MLDAKTALAPLHNPALHNHGIAERRRRIKLRTRFHQRISHQSVPLQHFRLAKSGCFKQRIGTSIEIFKKSREVHNPRRVAVAPFHVNLFAVAQHLVRSSRSRGVYRIATVTRNPFFLHPLPHYTLAMQLLDGFFRSPIVEPLFSDAAAVQSILDFEAALARAQARAGLIPEAFASTIASSCRAELFDLSTLAQAMPSAGNLAIPLLKQLTAIVARTSPDAARHV